MYIRIVTTVYAFNKKHKISTITPWSIAAYFTTEHRHQRRPVVIVNNDGDINDNSEHDVDDYNEENSLK